ncbi:LPXTG cell wall anchor domain-containing protein [Candidatus Saccharibacteria bacterium]|nr:LPXTG cell wall anchor domain-containing protein [Candidatus Saccharibacteria bacterium]
MTTLAYKINLPHLFAASYNCSSYGAGSYNSSQVCGATTTTSGGTGTTASGGSLANTGVHVILPIVIGVALIVAAALLLFRKSKKSAS